MPDPSFLQSAAAAVADKADTLVGAILGAMFTIIGVLLTNRANQSNLKLQLAHDEAKHKREYELAVRRDVYLQAAEGIAAALNSMIGLCQLDVEYSKVMEGFESRSAQIARIHIVATEKTALLMTELMTSLGQSLIQLNTERAALVVLRSRMRTQIERMNRHNAARDQYLELMKQENFAGSKDAARWEHIQSSFNFEQEQANNSADEHDEILSQLRPRHIAFVQQCMSEQSVLRLRLLPLIESVRQELDMPINIALYAQAMPKDPPFTEEQLQNLFHAGDRV